MSMWETLRSDPEASNWFVISLLGFWVRYPDAIGTGTATVPEYLAGAVHLFTRYWYELAILEDDLADCIDEFRMAYEHYYSGSSFLRLKKFVVVYNVDNFYVRVHKLIENLYRLLGQLVDLDPGRAPKPGEPSFRKQVRVRRIDEATDLDRYAARKVDELSRTLEPIRVFREQIFHVLLDKLEERAPTP